jgi:hypothetical protein
LLQKKNTAPFLKARNPRYLSLVCGHNYQHPAKHAKLIKQKSISEKLKASIVEHDVDMALLQA